LFVQGALATAATFCLIYWAIAIKGPTYPAMFNPLALIFVAISEAILLDEPIRLGKYECFSFLINPMSFTISLAKTIDHKPTNKFSYCGV